MTKQEFFAFGATCGLQVMCDGHNVGKINRFYTEYDSVGILFTNYTFDYGLSDIKPIVRHLSDLTKECVQADYNDGNPFVPIEIINAEFGWKDDCFARLGEFDLMSFNAVRILLKWHFNLMDEGEEVIYVTDDFNPYK